MIVAILFRCVLILLFRLFLVSDGNNFKKFNGTPVKFFRYVTDVTLLMTENECSWLLERESDPYPDYPRREYARK